MFEQETESLVKDLKSVEGSYGMDILALTVICGYLDRLFGNPRIERYLKKYHPDILGSISSLLTELKAGKKQETRGASQTERVQSKTGLAQSLAGHVERATNHRFPYLRSKIAPRWMKNTNCQS